MREIKFRAFNYIHKTMQYDVQDTYDWEEVTCSYEGELARFALMQYTGLKDKNGKEIYEGDIVACFDFEDAHFRSETFYRNGAFGYRTQLLNDTFIGFDSNPNFKWDNDKSDRIKVLGNIYENPELLECKDNV